MATTCTLELINSTKSDFIITSAATFGDGVSWINQLLENSTIEINKSLSCSFKVEAGFKGAGVDIILLNQFGASTVYVFRGNDNEFTASLTTPSGPSYDGIAKVMESSDQIDYRITLNESY